MAYFRKGLGLIKTSYKSNFKMRSLNVKFKAGGSSFTPQLYGVDGLSSVNIVDESLGKAMITAPLDVISIDLPPEYENIGSKAFLSCSNLESVYVYANKVITIADDAFPANCVVYVDNEFLTEYQTDHPLLDIRGFDSGYVYEIPHQDGLTPTTLTAQYVNDLFDGMTLDRKTKIGKVIVPVYFTAYESGSINAIIAKTPNLEHLVTCYDAGNIDLDMNGDVVAKIIEIGKTVDEALCYARTMSSPNEGQPIIVPPLAEVYSSRPQGYLSNKTNLVAVYGLRFTTNTGNDYRQFLNSDVNLIYLEVKFGSVVGMYSSIENVQYKYAYCDFSETTSIGYWGDPIMAIIKNSLVELTLVGWKLSDVNISTTNISTRSALLKLINSLGTPSTLRYLTIGATKYAKLTDADVQIARNKNWWVGWTETTTIPYVGNATLTSSYLNTLLGYPGKERCTKIVIPTDFSISSVVSVIVGNELTLFSSFSSLPKWNIYYGDTPMYDGQVFTGVFDYANYDEYDYVESQQSGGSINTGYIPNANSIIEAKALLYATSDENCYGCGSENNERINIGTFSSGNLQVAVGNWISYTIVNDELPHVYLMDCPNIRGYIDGVGDSGGSISGLRSKTFFVFSRSGISHGHSKCYYITAKENGEYKMKLIPAKRKSDSVSGLYDTISNTFFTTSGLTTGND